MTYLIAVVADRIQAEEAYTALESAGINQQQMTIVGRGYSSADPFAFIDPQRQSKQRAIFMAYWLVPFGFVAGFSFNLITGLHTLDWAGEPGNHIVGGLLGMVGGAMGSIFVGGGIGLSFGGREGTPYRDYLNQGKYLVIVQGSEALRTKANRILGALNPEDLQSYNDLNEEYSYS
jgi:hypothetical protein